ncbi:hypothetical protein BDK51DRAFT_18151 [Blyttiomyces helicus]|uniref:Uncharacterized protein n=1 Tax=Blyttiomyces helicus TaxID=388810 RepID=A0A4P9W0L8_9FUNG|nr:hypothetical protein BDK51DRAFT_18151 [Blyttiomyces helicus]|eukprot:RKO85691.1 hypothetical protein BDK51DRAFT_18151 [Blyttiomyces helicus]
MSRLTFGNASMQKLCLHSLVRLISNMPGPDDTDLVSWAIFLMHEFVVKDIGRDRFCKIKGMLKVLNNLISNDDVCISHIILRTLKYLGMRNEAFQLDIIRSGIVRNIVPCLKSDEEDIQCWSLVSI